MKRLDHFKDQFKETLALALAVYPDAEVEVHERGVTLRPSRPPVAPSSPRVVAIGCRGGRRAAGR